MSERFERDKPIGKALAEWWQGLENDRASRAILRRAAGPTEVALSAPYQRLYRRLQLQGWNPDSKAYLDDRLAAAVGLLAHVREDSPGLSPAKSMSQRKAGDDRLAVSELRFLRLLDARDIDGIPTAVAGGAPRTGREVTRGSHDGTYRHARGHTQATRIRCRCAAPAARGGTWGHRRAARTTWPA